MEAQLCDTDSAFGAGEKFWEKSSVTNLCESDDGKIGSTRLACVASIFPNELLPSFLRTLGR